jgi:hypothetical protein
MRDESVFADNTLFTSGSPDAVKALGEYFDNATGCDGYSMTLEHTDAGMLVRAVGAMLNGTPDILVCDDDTAVARERSGEPITAADYLTRFLSDMASEAGMEWV